MDFYRILMQVTWAGVILAEMATAAVAAQLAKPNCQDRCGDVGIPYPFGTTEDCYLDESFFINCTTSSTGNFLPFSGETIVQNISIHGQLDILMYTANDCYNETGSQSSNQPYLTTADIFTISNTQNKFVAVGCDTNAFLYATRNSKSFYLGCVSSCQSISDVINGSCSGIGCCEVEIPKGLKKFSLESTSNENHTGVLSFNPCSFAFVVKRDLFNFSSYYLDSLRYNETVPMVLDWAIGNDTCKYAQTKSGYVCGGNSTCYDSDNGNGYRCRCNDGYDGNPYLHDGCQDIDECNPLRPCKDTNQICTNLAGSYSCSCREGYEEYRLTIGTICREKGKQSRTIIIALGVGIGIIVALLFSSWIYIVLKRKKFIKLKEKYFQQNGGFILERRLNNSQRGSHETVKIFTAEELEKATKRYDESRIIGRGGFGVVYKGFLSDNRIVAIKKSKIVDQKQAEQFINEVVVLSQINHKHIVKLLGCCLETQVPLLVYEFVPKGTLFQYIHQDSSISTLPWEIRLRIATETAEALWYLHSAASPPIIHRDVKSSNILLDDNFTAKVSDFGTSRLVPQDEMLLATVVQGTLGYLDPEYLQTNQLTEKSDVYSFGVVLVELLTGKNVLSSNRPEEERSLAAHFLSSLKNHRLFEILENHIVGEGNEEQIKEFVEIAMSCLEVKGEERPTMKEVAIRLDGLRKRKKHPWVNVDLHEEEAENLLDATCVASFEIAGYDSINNHVPVALGDGR
ncbi:Wall-associated receptor kinase 2 [Morella rubra]|uniref:Wall-associated receptor kinase 2 n=1 Tax=Morella rubra TaxID=262757 RepID=A0A6A1VLK5_9ROSI|nr:Wall-associated receptor kinase 2 [Morella rubra]